MIKLTTGNLLQCDVEALVNTVNCVGVMGKGIALQFKMAYPENFKSYERACRAEAVKPGFMHVFEVGRMTAPRFIINFPTKRHWKGKSKLEDIKTGLVDLVATIRKYGIRSIAVPPLGCGNGGLDWAVVYPLIVQAFAELPEVEVHLFAPVGAPAVADVVNRTERPAMTRGRALLVKLMEQYQALGYTQTMLELQKHAYFLQALGLPMKLNFAKLHYGPYADNLYHVLRVMEGHYTSGFDGDRNPTRVIKLLPGAVQAADDFLANDKAAKATLERVSQLIEGYESQYGMELLATVHWASVELPEDKRDLNHLIEAIGNWNIRKKMVFLPNHIATALNRLHEEGLTAVSAQDR